MQIVRSDRAPEFSSKTAKAIYNEYCIKHLKTVAHSSWENGFAEQAIQHVSTNVALPPGAHEGQYNLPTSNGTVACIIIGDQQLGTSKNKIAVTAVNGETKYLNVGAPQSDPLSYTFFFPYATSGYFFDINNKKKTTKMV